MTARRDREEEQSVQLVKDTSSFDDLVSESSHDLESDDVPSNSHSSVDEDSSPQDAAKKPWRKRETNTCTPTKNLTDSEKHLRNSENSDRKMVYNTNTVVALSSKVGAEQELNISKSEAESLELAQDEESDILTAKTSTVQPSSREKRTESVLESAQDSD
ncbi:Uncharacterized protein DAT39_014115, partial [Clarias magur]